MVYDYDMIVIGMGPSGMAVSAMASEMGLKVCAIEISFSNIILGHKRLSSYLFLLKKFWICVFQPEFNVLRNQNCSNLPSLETY